MARGIVLGLLLIATAAGCARVAESRFNPLNWFGRGEAVQTVAPAQGQGVDPANLVAQIVSLRIEQVPGGAIVRATGLPPRQGYYDPELVPLNRERPVDGVLTYQFRALPPLAATRSGTPQSREVIVGRFVSSQTLAGVRSIRVAGAQNALAARR